MSMKNVASTAQSTARGNGYAVCVEVDGKTYPSARAADAALGLTPGTVQHRAHSKHYSTYRWLGPTPGPRTPRTPEVCTLAKPLIEPAHWPFNGYSLRKSVLDPSFEPHRLVRRIGWRPCLRCKRPHFSDDVSRIRLCSRCGGLGGDPIGPASDEDLLT